jgi:hypothetical protein
VQAESIFKEASMGKINIGRVILGGLVAGLVMNISEFVLHAIVLKADGQAIMDDLNKRGFNVKEDPNMLMILVAITFVLGLLAVWTYAAIRPRMGAGPRTAVCAGMLVWALSYLYAATYVYAGFVIFPPKVVWVPAAWSFVEVPVATLIGAWLYKEE